MSFYFSTCRHILKGVHLHNREGEVVNPHQTTLLKLLDSYLMQAFTPNGSEGQNANPDVRDRLSPSQITPILMDKFLELIQNAQMSIRLSLQKPTLPTTMPSIGNMKFSTGSELTELDTGTGATPPLQNLDLILPKVCEALVIMVQCFCTLSIGQEIQGELSQEAQRVRQFLAEASSADGISLIENLVGKENRPVV